HAEAAGKSEFVMRVRPGGEYRFNFLQYASRRPGAEIGLAENLADLIATLGSVDGNGESKRTSDAYWDQALKQLVRNVVSVLHIAEGEITLDSLMGVIATLPEDPEHATEIEWQQRTNAGRMFQKLRSLELDARQERTVRVGAEFLLQEFPALDPRTRSSIVSTLTTLLDPFRHGEAHELFCTDCTIVPEACRLGAIVIMDLDLKTYGAFGRLGQVLFKWFVQQSVERDKIDAKTRGMFIYADEAQEFLTAQDKRFQATARSARVATVYLTQNLPALQARLGSEAEVNGLLGNLQTKIFCQNADPSTNKYAEQLFGDQDRFNVSINSNTNQGGGQPNQPSGNQGFGLNQAREPLVRAELFSQLAKGGPENDFAVEAFVFRGGKPWKASRSPLMLTVFDQRFG
ncbi:MAG: TraM recognition domain-containing protein, partial [Planctomycetota bacterium]